MSCNNIMVEGNGNSHYSDPNNAKPNAPKSEMLLILHIVTLSKVQQVSSISNIIISFHSKKGYFVKNLVKISLS